MLPLEGSTIISIEQAVAAPFAIHRRVKRCQRRVLNAGSKNGLDTRRRKGEHIITKEDSPFVF